MKKSRYLMSKSSVAFDRRKEPHDRFQEYLVERLKANGFRIFEDTYHQIWDRSEYIDLMDWGDPLVYFLRYKPDLIAFREGRSFWVEVKTTPQSEEVYFPLLPLALGANLRVGFGLPVCWAFRSPWMEKAFWVDDLLSLLPGKFEIVVGAHLSKDDWEPEVNWILQLLGKLGSWETEIRRRQLRGSGRPFVRLPQKALARFSSLEAFFGLEGG